MTEPTAEELIARYYQPWRFSMSLSAGGCSHLKLGPLTLYGYRGFGNVAIGWTWFSGKGHEVKLWPFANRRAGRAS